MKEKSAGTHLIFRLASIVLSILGRKQRSALLWAQEGGLSLLPTRVRGLLANPAPASPSEVPSVWLTRWSPQKDLTRK